MQWQHYATRKRSIDTISPYLLSSCIKSRKWDSVHYYLYQAHLPDENYSYALHLVCQDLCTPLHIIRMIYFAFPDAAIYLDADRRTPLFIAAEYFFEEAAVFLSYQRPEASLIPNRVGMKPIQHALEGFGSNHILNAILKSNPMTIMQPDEDGVAILESFFDERNCKLRAIIENDNNILWPDMEMKQFAAYHMYSKGVQLLKAATMEHFSQSNHDDSNWSALHAVCEVDVCPWSFCNLLMQVHTEEAMKADVNGNLPIHIILSASKDLSDEHTIKCSYCGTEEKVYYAPNEDDQFSGLCCECHDANVEDAEERIKCMVPAQKVVETVRDLLAIDTKMANVPDENGNLPLTISILNEQEYITTKLIFDASPEIGQNFSASDGLFPFMSAAVGDWDDEIDQINTVFFLLQEEPAIIKCLSEKNIK